MRVLCFGDSNTYGYDPRSYFGSRYGAEDRWVDILEKLSGWEIINKGENGRRIPSRQHELERFDRMLTRYQPLDLLVVMLGSNDLLQGAEVSRAAGDMARFLERIPLRRDQILLLAPPPMKIGEWVPDTRLVEASLQLAQAYRVLADEMGLHFLDAGAWDVALTFDGVHFTPEAHRSFAAGMYENIEKYHVAKNQRPL